MLEMRGQGVMAATKNTLLIVKNMALPICVILKNVVNLNVKMRGK